MGGSPKEFRSGFIAIIGAPNAGKSTFLNRILGEKISITSKRPQTTRNRIIGVLHRPSAQLVFIDTPGIHKAGNLLAARIVETALATFADADIILLVIDVAKPDPPSEKLMVDQFQGKKAKVLLALNKIDLIHKKDLLKMIDRWSRAYPFEAIVPISAVLGTQVEVLMETLENLLPPGPPFFPQDTITDMSERFLVAEMIREKVFRLTGEEIPFSTAVTIDSFKAEKNGKLVKIYASIHMERESQKGIVIGKGGTKLKSIGEKSRAAIERFLGTRVYLELFVRVQKNWSKDTKALRRFGY